MTVDVTMLGFLIAAILLAVLWWVKCGTDFMYRHFRFCTGCRRDAVNCSCPLPFVFTPWESLSDEERGEAE